MQQTIKGEDPALSIILGPQDEDRVFDRDDDGQRPQHERNAADDAVVIQDGSAAAKEDQIQRIERRRADIAEDDADGRDGQRDD
jgi:hypothetical protein